MLRARNPHTNVRCPQWAFSSSTNQLTTSGFTYDAALALYLNGGTQFSHINNVGSTAVRTNQAGTAVEDMLFYPWRQNTWQSWGSGGYQFAGMPYYDTTTNTNPAMYRFYSMNVGRWHSPDPLGGDITNPQSLNRYAYVLNNPTSMVDPLGLDSCAAMNVFNGSWEGSGTAPWANNNCPPAPGCDQYDAEPACDPENGSPSPPFPPGGGNGQFPEGTTPIPPGQGPVGPWPTPTGCVDATGEPTDCLPWWVDLLPLGGLGPLINQMGPGAQPQSPAQMSPCAQKVFGQVQSNLSGNWGFQQELAPEGGHPNFLFFSYNTQYVASDFNQTSWFGLNPGLRFGTIPSLHVPGGSGANPVFAIAHLDFFNPLALYGLELVPHVVVDVVLGHIIQWLDGSFGC